MSEVFPGPIVGGLFDQTDPRMMAISLVTEQHNQMTALAASIPAVLVAGALELSDPSNDNQAFKDILDENSVLISLDNKDLMAIKKTMEQLDQLIQACSTRESEGGRAPGFWTSNRHPSGQREWAFNDILPAYQTMNCTRSEFGDLPLPSPADAKRIYRKVREAFQLYMQYVQNPVDSCTCLSVWWGSVVLPQICRQIMEQSMVEDASDFLTHSENFHVTSWNESYSPENGTLGSISDQLPRHSTPMLFVSHRDHYINIVIKAMMAAKNYVFISTCYVFHEDPAHFYVLFNVLPHLAMKGIKVYFLMDLFVFESSMLQNPFRQDKKATEHQDRSTLPPQPDAVTVTSFFDHLPSNSPTPTRPRFSSRYDVFDTLLQLSKNEDSNFEMRFWCARDVSSGYRIKNHSKGVLVDDQWAMFGGSNITPTLGSALGDLDCVVHGEAAKVVADSLWNLWEAVDTTTARRPPFAPYNPDLDMEHFGISNPAPIPGVFSVPQCTLSILQSTPTSTGEDSIYRVVLERIESARSSITVSMGHCCYPQSFADALARAAARRVQSIELMVNSYHSCDLRGGQRDCFLSIGQLLEKVPSAKVYATAHQQRDMGETFRPDFLHGKYVIVDGEWSAVGSWNLWTRSSFYELETEAFVESQEVASLMQAKFDKDRTKNCVQVNLEDCERGNKFCPKGCMMCRGFGPFFAGAQE